MSVDEDATSRIERLIGPEGVEALSAATVMVIGIGGGILQFTVGSDFVFSLGGVALSTVVGIILNLIIPKTME